MAAPATGSAGSVVARDRWELPAPLGPWTLVSLLAQGRLSQVYAAQGTASDQDLPPPYAIKVLRKRWWQDADKLACLRKEAFLGQRINHPHLVPVLASQLEQAPFYLVMPRLPGLTLQGLLRRRWRPSLALVLSVARQVAQALAELERHGWLHGDVKPANVMLSPEGHATLLDLGYARALDEVSWHMDRPLIGTPFYMAPEMFVSTLKVDIRADLYSLGVMMYELLTGVRPFPGPSLSQVVSQHLTQTPRPLRYLVPWVPREVAQLVHTLLAKEPLRRPESAQEAVDRLVRLEIQYLDHREPVR